MTGPHLHKTDFKIRSANEPQKAVTTQLRRTNSIHAEVYLFNKSSQHVCTTRPFNTFAKRAFSTHLCSTSFRHIFSTRLYTLACKMSGQAATTHLSSKCVYMCQRMTFTQRTRKHVCTFLHIQKYPPKPKHFKLLSKFSMQTELCASETTQH